MKKRLRQLVRPLPRLATVSDRAVVLALTARFYDELLGGLPTVLSPTLRAHFGLTYLQLGLLPLALDVVAALVEPVAGLVIDVWRRRWLMAWGAAAIGLATALMGLAPDYVVLVLALAAYGLGSGPLAHTADVVLVESYPTVPERIFTRSTAIDTVGALLSPLLVVVVFRAGGEWRLLLTALGASGLIYALLLLRTRFPPPQSLRRGAGSSLWAHLRMNIRQVLGAESARTWLIFLFILGIIEAPRAFVPVWLNEEVGLSQAGVGAYEALELTTELLGLVLLERWLARSSHRRILQGACLALLGLVPLWLFTPSVWARLALAVPLSFFMTVFWPIARSRALTSVPGRAGAVSALLSLYGLVPLKLLFGALAELIGLTWSIFLVQIGGLLLMLLVTFLHAHSEHAG